MYHYKATHWKMHYDAAGVRTSMIVLLAHHLKATIAKWEIIPNNNTTAIHAALLFIVGFTRLWSHLAFQT